MPDHNRIEFSYDILRRIGAPLSRENATAILAWQAFENTRARWNPLATTWRKPGSTAFNAAGVQNYVSYEQGLDATVDTLLLSYYTRVVAAFRNDAGAPAVLTEVARSPWGSGSGPLERLPWVRTNWDRWAVTLLPGSDQFRPERDLYPMAGAGGTPAMG
jgi:hypothetical protein